MTGVLKKLSKREKVLLFTLLIAIIVASMVTFLVKPAIDRNGELSDKLFNIETDEMTIRNNISRFDSLAENFVNIQDEVNGSLGEIYPIINNYEIDALTTDLMLSHNLEPKNLSITEAVVTQITTDKQSAGSEEEIIPILSSTVNMRLEGMLSDLMKLIDTMEENKMLQIKTCGITSVTGDLSSIDGEFPEVLIILTFDIYMHGEGTKSTQR